ncbi:MAG: hypothetical protein M2R46_05036 [Verrucomicrobia subdivision 3 bacterium]|nr:hypothetical protein [Limisphaerales bacterium]
MKQKTKSLIALVCVLAIAPFTMGFTLIELLVTHKIVGKLAVRVNACRDMYRPFYVSNNTILRDGLIGTLQWQTDATLAALHNVETAEARIEGIRDSALANIDIWVEWGKAENAFISDRYRDCIRQPINSSDSTESE